MSAALWADDELVFAPEPKAFDYEQFLRILAGYRPGAEVTADAIRDDMAEGVQATPNQMGMCFDRVVRSTRPERRGAWNRIWIRSEVSA